MIIKGIITKIISYPSASEPTVFNVVDENGIEQKCQYQGFFPVKMHDKISAEGEVNGKTLVISEKPLVIVPSSIESLKKSLVIALKGSKFGPMKADKLIGELMERYDSKDVIIEKLNQWASAGVPDDFIENLNAMQTKKLLSWWDKNYNKRRLYLLGFNNKEIMQSNMCEEDLYKAVIKNALNISSISVDKALEINKLTGIVENESDMLGGKISRLVFSNHQKGWMATPLSYIIRLYGKEVSKNLSHIKENFNLIFENEYIYSDYSYNIEIFLAEKIKSLLVRNEDDKLRAIELPHGNIINPIQVEDGIQLTDEQHLALEGSLAYHISIITGGAGCGKTTLIRQIIKNLNERKKKFLVVSFTGKAVLRIKETLGSEVEDVCFTLSRLIHKKKNFQKIPKFSTLIVDESSMVSSELIHDFMTFFSHHYKIILIGDCNQLPPIGLGSFFQQVIASDKVPIFRLTINKRIISSEGVSNILINANKLISERNLSEDFDFRTGLGFEMIEGGVEICKKLLKGMKKNGVDMKKITILTPFNKNISEINSYAAQVYLDGVEGRKYDSVYYFLGERVMQTSNVYNEEHEIMNGEEGYITYMNEEFLQVAYSPTKTINYKWKIESKQGKADEQNTEKEFVISDIKHSYCKTIHKSQGSEYEFVILYIPHYNGDFININLLYTAITRTIKKIWVVGDLKTIKEGCKKTVEIQYQKLASRLQN
jgi:GTPase SAR1 family protein